MISLEKWMIFTPLHKLPKNGENWGKLIEAKAFKKLPKVQNIAQSGHTGHWAATAFKYTILRPLKLVLIFWMQEWQN